jgi:thioredoxin-related protein
MTKRILLTVLTACIVAATALSGEKGDVRWTTFSNGLELAKQTNKRILIDVYTDWCGWCKRMDQDVYRNEEVAAYLDRQFVLVKLNAESSNPLTFEGKPYTEMSLASSIGINSYPTTVFAETDGSIITPVAGYIEAGSFLEVCKFIGDGFYKKMSWQEFQENKGKEEKGERSEKQ